MRFWLLRARDRGIGFDDAVEVGALVDSSRDCRKQEMALSMNGALKCRPGS